MKPIRDLRSYGDSLVNAADPSKGGRAAARALAQRQPSPLIRRVVVVLSSAAVFVGANVGLAFAANPSVPGDPLYGLDRAYERVAGWLGIHQNLAAERFREAAELSDRGHLGAAFETASEAMDQLNPTSHAADVLTEAAADVKGVESDDLPADLQDRLNDQAKELFGIGEDVSLAATSDLEFDKRADQVLEAIRSAMEARGLPPGLSDEGPPGLNGDLPPGQGGTTPPGKSGD
jgi:hypothetical protein